MRLEGWEHRLSDLVTNAQTRVFAYGTWDCCLFACAAIQALTGRNPGEAFALEHTDEDSCDRVLADAGGLRRLASRLAADYGFLEITPLEAQRGDVVLGVIADHETLGVCMGSKVAFAMAPQGIRTLSITRPELRVAWRIA